MSEHVAGAVSEKMRGVWPRNHDDKLSNTNGCARSHGPSTPGVGVMSARWPV